MPVSNVIPSFNQVVIKTSRRLDIVGMADHPPYLDRLLKLIKSTSDSPNSTSNCEHVVTLIKDSVAAMQLDAAAFLWEYARSIWPDCAVQLGTSTRISLPLSKLSGDTERIQLHLRSLCLANLADIDRMVSSIPQSRDATCLNISFGDDSKKAVTAPPKQQQFKDDGRIWTAVATLYFVPPRVRIVRWPSGGMGATVNVRLMESTACALLCSKHVTTLDVRGNWMSNTALRAAAAINPALPEMIQRSLSDVSNPDPPVYTHTRTLQYHRDVINCITWFVCFFCLIDSKALQSRVPTKTYCKSHRANHMYATIIE